MNLPITDERSRITMRSLPAMAIALFRVAAYNLLEKMHKAIKSLENISEEQTTYP